LVSLARGRCRPHGTIRQIGTPLDRWRRINGPSRLPPYGRERAPSGGRTGGPRIRSGVTEMTPTAAETERRRVQGTRGTESRNAASRAAAAARSISTDCPPAIAASALFRAADHRSEGVDRSLTNYYLIEIAPPVRRSLGASVDDVVVAVAPIGRRIPGNKGQRSTASGHAEMKGMKPAGRCPSIVHVVIYPTASTTTIAARHGGGGGRLDCTGGRGPKPDGVRWPSDARTSVCL
jgi:hypothetical protein